MVNKVNEYPSDSSIASFSDNDSSYQVCYVIHRMQINSLRHLEQQYILCNQKGHKAHTCNIMINYILAETAARKDLSPKDKIIKSFKHFCHRHQFTPKNC